MNRESYFTAITQNLGALAYQITIANSTGLVNVNTLSEDLIRDFFNKTYDLDLKNINIVEEANFPAIDLADQAKSLALQVTSDGSSRKINKTLKKFTEKELHKNYKKLQIVVLKVQKPKYSSKFKTNGTLEFDQNKDIKDLGDVVRDIRGLQINKVREIYELLENELTRQRGTKPSRAGEVETIIDLIVYLTSNKVSASKADVELPPDPEFKIQKRFSDHTDYLIKEIQELIPIYSDARDKAETALGMDQARITLRARYLMNKSNSILNACKGNPKKALDKFTTTLSEQLSQSGKNYDEGAIRYFLIHEILNCNVFPNTK